MRVRTNQATSDLRSTLPSLEELKMGDGKLLQFRDMEDLGNAQNLYGRPSW